MPNLPVTIRGVPPAHPSGHIAISSDAVEVRFETHGAGSPALVFVHGWSCDRSYWRGQVEALADRFQTVAIDLAGHGDSGTGRRAWTMKAFGEDVLAVVEQLDLRSVVLVGHSMGGDVVAETAVRLGSRVLGLVWVDVYRTFDEAPNREDVESFVAALREDFVATTRAFVRRMFPAGSDPALVEHVADDMASAAPDIAIDALRHAVGNHAAVRERLRDLSAPVVAVNASYRPTDVASLERLGVRVMVVPEVGHFLMLEAPQEFNRLLSEIVDGFVRGASSE